ncbi:MAG: hypothetical protein ACFBQW_09030, partial [Sphingomonadaceae bacterium]
MRRALFLLPLLCGLAACGAPGEFPSLEPRPIESADFEPPPAPPPPVPDPELQLQVSVLIAEARAGEAAFAAALAEAARLA